MKRSDSKSIKASVKNYKFRIPNLSIINGGNFLMNSTLISYNYYCYHQNRMSSLSINFVLKLQDSRKRHAFLKPFFMYSFKFGIFPFFGILEKFI